MTDTEATVPSDGKFRKIEHILKSKDFRAVYTKGFGVKAGPLSLLCLPNGLAHNRLGFSIGSRKVRLASRRNRIRRLLREVYRTSKPCFKTGFDMVLVIKRDAHEMQVYKEVERLLLKAIKNAGLVA